MSSAIDPSEDSCGSRGMQNQVQFLFAYSSTDPSLKNTKKDSVFLQNLWHYPL